MPRSILSNAQKERVYDLANDGFSQTKIAQLYDVSQGTISNVLKGKRYQEEIHKRDSMLTAAAARGFESAAEKHIANQSKRGMYIEG